MDVRSVYERIGGAETLSKLVDRFYAKVQAHPNLSKLFPEDITPIRDKQYKFLTQFFGGPPLYTDVYGPPMMRYRHLPHPITPTRAKEWLSCMAEAMDEIELTGPVRDFMMERLSMVAEHMVNREDSPSTEPTDSPAK
ncbi:hypothetical protein GCM10025857_36520 [Alicyclobacillus contaminans]|uniref:globin domain-containing protein n=1 Tax=Alicyclobacillus contaminans TaxID=392016 RepID=UPI00040784E5|nr:globin [Alicyclobacillus contaminans]GMA52295.1 hypothetical protein GCM10025857_36520 [Alicyclobacillus contaminans]